MIQLALSPLQPYPASCQEEKVHIFPFLHNCSALLFFSPLCISVVTSPIYPLPPLSPCQKRLKEGISYEKGGGGRREMRSPPLPPLPLLFPPPPVTEICCQRRLEQDRGGGKGEGRKKALLLTPPPPLF